jgi:hypothetical protein
VTEEGVPLVMIYSDHSAYLQKRQPKEQKKRKAQTTRPDSPKKSKKQYQDQISFLFRKNSTLSKIDLRVLLLMEIISKTNSRMFYATMYLTSLLMMKKENYQKIYLKLTLRTE